MPKGKTKGGSKGNSKRGGPRNGSRSLGLSDDESLNGDACSTLSICSDRGSFDDGENGNDGIEHDEVSSSSNSRELLEEKISEAIELMTEKAASTRIGAMKSLVLMLSQQFIPEMLFNRRETLRDNLEKLLKKGQSNEQGLATEIAQLLILQIGALDIDTATVDFNALRPAFQQLALDHTVSASTRSKAIEAWCVGLFLVDSGEDDILKTSTLLQPLFLTNRKQQLAQKSLEESAIAKTNATSKGTPVKSSHGSIAPSALSGWSLLLTLLPESYLQSHCNDWIQSLYKLLEDPELELRLNAGETMALLGEMCNLHEDYEVEDEEDAYGSRTSLDGTDHKVDDQAVNIQVVIDKLRSLSVESRKYRAKRDRRQQRHNFRDYLRAVENGESPELDLKFGCGEILEVDSWVKKRRYDAIAQVLGPGINRHLSENVLVRQILELGAPMLVSNEAVANSKQAKSERHYMNSMNFKARSVARGKSRDFRRTDFLEG